MVWFTVVIWQLIWESLRWHIKDKEGITYYKEAKTNYEKTLELCKDYSELSALKADIQKVINDFPLSLKESDVDYKYEPIDISDLYLCSIMKIVFGIQNIF